MVGTAGLLLGGLALALNHALHEGLRLSGELALGADLVAVLVKQEGEGNADQGKEGWDGRGPVNAEVVVHVGGEQRESSTEQRSEHGVGGQDGGGEDSVSVNQVVEDTKEDENHAEAEGNTGSDTGHPVDGRRVGPGEPEETNGQCKAAKHGRRKTSLGRSHAAILLLNLDVVLVVPDGEGYGEEHTDHDTQEGQATNALAPATVDLVDDRESGEEHVESAVDDGHVDGEEQHNGLLEEQDPGTRQGGLEGLDERRAATLVVHLANVDLTSHLGQLSSTLTQQNGGVGLGDEDGAHDPEKTREGGQEAHDPAPASVHAEEATDDGAENGAEEGSGGEDGHSNTTLGGREHVGDDTTGVGERRGAKGTGEETEDDEGVGVLGTSAAGVEGREGSVGSDKEPLTTKDLTHGRPQ